MAPFPERCVAVTDGKVVSVSAHKRKFIIKNKKGICIRKIFIDDCLVENVDGQMVCDYGLWIEEKELAYIVELKGMDIVHACKQIFETIQYIRKYHLEELDGKKIEAAIVCSKFKAPKLIAHPAYVKLKNCIKREPIIKVNQLEVHC